MKLSSVLLAAGVAIALQHSKRAVIDHDAVVGLPQTVPSGTVGTLELKYKPYLYVANGCVPFPAVDAEGNTSGGLAPTGGTTDGCSSSTGQVYSHCTSYGGYYAIMYAWYMPKDEPISGIGHRHDWEGIIVWLSAESTSASIVSVCASAHGDWDCDTTPPLSGNAPLVEYVSYFPLDHQMALTTTVGSMQPLLAWESMTTTVQNALANTDWGDANVPFIPANFDNNLAAALP